MWIFRCMIYCLTMSIYCFLFTDESTPWKINGWNLQITHLRKEKMIWTKPPWLWSMLIFQGDSFISSALTWFPLHPKGWTEELCLAKLATSEEVSDVPAALRRAVAVAALAGRCCWKGEPEGNGSGWRWVGVKVSCWTSFFRWCWHEFSLLIWFVQSWFFECLLISVNHVPFWLQTWKRKRWWLNLIVMSPHVECCWHGTFSRRKQCKLRM